MHTSKTSRRQFVRNLAALSALATGMPQVLNAKQLPQNSKGENFRFLFQGDSITDGNRTRNNDWNHLMGHGYQYIIASKLWYENPEKKFQFFNRGISGNTIPDLSKRWQQDTIDIKPDLLSILIGINDLSRFLQGNESFNSDKYEIDYTELLKQTKQQLPDTQLVLCEPFALPVGKLKDKWKDYVDELEKRSETVKKLSKEHNAFLIKFQDAFNKALSRAPAEYWIWDGIHPMPAGHELMAREWLQQVSKKIRFL